ncbi:MAG: LCP family protein, partial [Chloroflexota bacterium]
MNIKNIYQLISRFKYILYLFAVGILGVAAIGLILFIPVFQREAEAPQPTENPNFILASPTQSPITQPPPINPETATQNAIDATSTAEANEPIPATNIPTVIPNSFTPTPFPLLYNEFGEYIPVTWGNYPPPSTWPYVHIPPPVGLIPIPDGQVNILLLGNDHRRKLGTRTDTIMLLSLNPGTGIASLVSFPRDLFVYAPGWTMYKINTVQPRGGYDLLKATFEYNFGVRPDYYVNINRDTFVEVVNSLGGIDVDVPVALSDPTFARGKFYAPAGNIHMDGATARWYASSRNTTNVYSRDKRQQAILKGIFLKLLSLNGLQRAPELYATYYKNVRTDIDINTILTLIPMGSQLSDTRRISQHAINSEHVTAIRAPVSNAYILLPDQMKIFQVMLKAIQ